MTLNRPPVPEGWEFRLSHDRRLFAFYDPGNGPWFVPEPSMRGRFVDSADMNRLDWYRYVPAPDEGEQPITLTPCVHLKSLHEAEHAGLIVEGCSWCVGREQLGTPGHTKPLVRVTSTGVRPGLNSAERAMLRYALELTEDKMAAEPDEFAAVDRAAVESLKQLAGEE
jgi:hypothetical protein